MIELETQVVLDVISHTLNVRDCSEAIYCRNTPCLELYFISYHLYHEMVMICMVDTTQKLLMLFYATFSLCSLVVATSSSQDIPSHCAIPFTPLSSQIFKFARLASSLGSAP